MSGSVLEPEAPPGTDEPDTHPRNKKNRASYRIDLRREGAGRFPGRDVQDRQPECSSGLCGIGTDGVQPWRYGSSRGNKGIPENREQ